MTPGFPKNSSSNQKKLCIDPAFQKNLFITKRKVPTQPRIPQVNCCFFCKRKKPGPRLSKKLFFKQKNNGSSRGSGTKSFQKIHFPKKVDRAAVFQNNLFPTKREVPTRRVPLVNFCLFFLKKKDRRDPGFQKILLKKNLDRTAWDQLSKKIFF